MERGENLILLQYISYVYDLVGCNFWYINFKGSDIGLFDNCSWESFKRNEYGEG